MMQRWADRWVGGRRTDETETHCFPNTLDANATRAGTAGLENGHLAAEDWISKSLMDGKSRGTF